jgi:hypothetical protein
MEPKAVPLATSDDVAAVIAPLAWIATLAFATGFWGCLIVAPFLRG